MEQGQSEVDGRQSAATPRRRADQRAARAPRHGPQPPRRLGHQRVFPRQATPSLAAARLPTSGAPGTPRILGGRATPSTDRRSLAVVRPHASRGLLPVGPLAPRALRGSLKKGSRSLARAHARSPTATAAAGHHGSSAVSSASPSYPAPSKLAYTSLGTHGNFPRRALPTPALPRRRTQAAAAAPP
jgi:hypothetical protein